MKQRKRPPKIVTMNISASGFRDYRSNAERTEIATTFIQSAPYSNISAIFYPSGYLLAKTESEINPLVRPLIRQAKRSKVSFVLGVDLQEIKSYRYASPDFPAMLNAVKNGKIPCFLVVYDATIGKTSILRQRSASSYHAHSKMLPDNVMVPHILDVAGVPVQIIFCGEIYDTRLLSGDAPKTAVILGHRTMTRLTQTMRGKSKRGFTLLNSEHRTGKYGMSFCFKRGEECGYYHKEQIEMVSGFWIELACWKIGARGGIRYISK